MRYLVLFSLLSLFLLSCGNKQPSPPDILLFIVDRWTMAEDKPYPAFDQLKANGIHFTNAFTTSPDPETAYKALLTSLHTGHLLSDQYNEASENNLSQFLENQGYQFHQLNQVDAYSNLNHTAPEFCLIRLQQNPSNELIAASLNRLLAIQEENPNTVVIATAFNGGKNDFSEASLRVPFVVTYPKKNVDSRILKHHIYTADIAPSIAEIIGATWPYPADGQSFYPALINKKVPTTNRILYWESASLPKIQILRYNQWKMVKTSEVNDWEIYDLITDPDEMDNVAAYHPGKKQKFMEWISKNR